MKDKRAEDRDEAFIVRHAASLGDLQWILQQAIEEGFLIRARDADSYFTAGLVRDFFIGELNGERISCISIVRHGESLAVVGFYIVIKPFRGKGYGLKTWKAAFGSISDKYNVQLYAVKYMQNWYRSMGFQPGWILRQYKFTVSFAREHLSSYQLPSSTAKILPASEADFEKLMVYGADMMGSSQACRSVLAAWLTHAQESSWVAIGNAGEVVGYLIMSELSPQHFSEEGYRVAPFFADSAPIARSLLKSAVEFAALRKSESFFLQISPDYNPDGVNLVESELGAKPTLEVVFMGNKEIQH